MRAALYLRVSTDDQTTHTQYSQLWAAAARADWTTSAKVTAALKKPAKPKLGRTG